MRIREFGNPILRQKAKKLIDKDVKSENIQKLIKQMQELLISKKMGVGLAAPQVGESLALAVICVRPVKHRKEVEEFDLTIINPEITKTYGRKLQQWEGCLSGGLLKSGLFARVPRYKKIELKYCDEKGRRQQKAFKGLAAHIIQHEVDHLNGTLFVDKVRDRTSFVTYNEYLKIVKAVKKSKKSRG
jgi:peptide deformylase